MSGVLVTQAGQVVLIGGAVAAAECADICCDDPGPGECAQLLSMACPSSYHVTMGPVEFETPGGYYGTITWDVEFDICDLSGIVGTEATSGGVSGETGIQPSPPDPIDEDVVTGSCLTIESGGAGFRLTLQCWDRADWPGFSPEDFAALMDPELASLYLTGDLGDVFVTLSANGLSFDLQARFAAALLDGQCLHQLGWTWVPRAVAPTYYATNAPGISWA